MMFNLGPLNPANVCQGEPEEAMKPEDHRHNGLAADANPTSHPLLPHQDTRDHVRFALKKISGLR